MMERQKITAGDKVEPIYGEQIETFTIISTDVRMRTNGQWVDAIVYASSRDGLGGAWKVMDKDSFYERYKIFGEVIEEDK
jgi:hypothetical protein